MDAVDERDLRLARRIKFGVRLVIYPMLLGLVAVAWHARGARGADDAQLSTWRGTSAQSQAVSAVLSDDWVQSMRIPVTLRCAGGDTYKFTWTPTPDIYRQLHGVLTAHRLPTTVVADDRRSRTYEGRLRLVLGDRMRGTVSVTEMWTWTATPDVGKTGCSSGPVAFSLTRSSS